MKLVSTLLISVVILTVLTAPRTEAVIYFGGSISLIIGCVNPVVYTRLGPPRGGPYLWSPSVTKTYSFGPPKRTGQWLLGSAGPSYFCVVKVFPLKTHPGLLMIMMGSSR